MRIDGRHHRTIWRVDDAVDVIDQTALPFRFATRRLMRWEDAEQAIRTMVVRGAPCIGATAAYGVCLALADDPSDGALERALAGLRQARPTAVDLAWAIDAMAAAVARLAPSDRAERAWSVAAAICDDSVETCRRIGEHGAPLLAAIHARTGRPVNVLTHCNAGWLATVDWGTALAPVYRAHDDGVPVHVWVDETRPRNQGAALTAFELGQHGVPHTVIADNAGGHLMQAGRVDLCLVGTDRTAANGDVANKIGTYLKALAAHDNGVPFYVALPHPTIDWHLPEGVGRIPIEERDPSELTHAVGEADDGTVTRVRVVSPGSPVANPAFDVTPARLVTGLITERGIGAASRDGLLSLYPERR